MIASARGARAWLALAALLAAGALLAPLWPTPSLDWQPGIAWTQPWRWWTAAFVHWSRWHLIANLAGVALVAALGVAAAVTARAALAWAIAWPLTQLGLLLKPELVHYGGLSGVLHAGVAVAGWQVARHGRGAQRAVGGLLLAGLAAKVLLESPWGPALRHPSDWDIAIAPMAHACGAVAGLLMALACELAGSRRHSPDDR